MSFTRRRFLLDGLRVTALVPALGLLPRRAPTAEGERVLVVVQLSGGNDGLNTVVPHRQDAYYRLRPTLGLKRASLQPLDDEHGLHPALAELGALYAEGRLSVVHGVGYPRPSRSHFRSLEIWHSGDPDGLPRGTGWLGRLADQLVARSPGSMPAMHLGDEDLPLALMGEQAFAPTLRDADSLRLAPLPGLERERAHVVAEGAATGELGFLRCAARNAYAAAERLERVVNTQNDGDYPDLDLARKLRLAAKLVRGGFDTRLFLVTLGGFDTHARQAALHAARLEELARSLAAFQRDLTSAGCAERVLTLVFSEFGRRAEENASRGTDHGAAAPVLLLGHGLRAGMMGTPPDLEHLEEGDVSHTADFRALYASLARDWMGLAPAPGIRGLDLFA